MKSREQKQKDLTTLTEQLQSSKSAMVVSFSKVTVNKDQEFRNQLREAGAKYQVVKNTLARIAVKGGPYEDTTEHFKGVTAIAWTDNDPVILSKAISRFIKDNADIYTFKAGIVDGRVVDFSQVTSIASLPSKEELISKLLWVLNNSAQRLVTVINAVPRDLAVVIKQIGDAKTHVKPDEPIEAKTEETPAAEEAPVEAKSGEAPAAEEMQEPAVESPQASEEAPNQEASAEAIEETTVESAKVKTEEPVPEAEGEKSE